MAKQELQAICENMMDNCLASNSETGGVGCDNMTMIIIALLKGKTKEEWYKQIADRVANGDGPCAPPEYGKYSPAALKNAFLMLFARQPNSAVLEYIITLIQQTSTIWTWTLGRDTWVAETRVASYYLATVLRFLQIRAIATCSTTTKKTRISRAK